MRFWAWGANNYGQLGLGTFTEQENRPVIVRAPGLPLDPGSIVRLAGGGGHTLLLDRAGAVYSTGWNTGGQLGLGHTQPVSVFTKLDTVCDKIVEIAAGWDFSILLTEHGEVFTCGNNSFGQLGNGKQDSKFQTSVDKVAGLQGIVGVAAGLRHALCVSREGDVFCWGAGSKGQLGVGTKVNKVWSPVKIDLLKTATGVFCGQYFTVVKLANGEIIGFGDNKHEQLCQDRTKLTVMQPITLENVTDQDEISCGWTHMTLTRDTGVRVRGRDNYHQHGGGEGGVTMTGVRKARAGSEHVLCLSEAGEVWSWGWNEHGNCGLGEVTPDTECISSPSRLPLDNIKIKKQNSIDSHIKMSVHGTLRGHSWSQFSVDSDAAPVVPPVSHAPGVRISPVPGPSDDVMKLPREDMAMFGRCPAWDNFVLVICDKCDKIVKIEAFESHMTLRHGSKSEKSAYHRVLAARAAASLQLCEVKLTSITPYSTNTHSSASSVAEAGSREAGEVELPSSSCTTPQPAPTRSPSPSPPPESEPMDTSDQSEPTPALSLPHKYVGEEADSTTNNVISIPDTDDMANIEIITEGQSLLDSMDFQQPPGPSVDSTSFTLTATSPSISVTPPISRSASVRTLDTGEASPSPGPSLPTQYITVSPLSKPSPTKKVVVSRMVQPHVAHPAPPSAEKKSSRDREYDANKHCGVSDPETKKPCTRSLTCKSHSVYLKRKVPNRSGDFDELLANHKAEKDAASAKLSAVSANAEDGSSILERRLKLTPGPGPVSGTGAGQARLVSGQIQVLASPAPTTGPAHSKPQLKESYCEDTLHYTTDHPKPLAVCTFGSKRMGGLFIADRSKLLTRKVMKLALRSVPIVRQQTMPYIVNFQSGVNSLSGISTISGIPARIGTIKLANSGVTNIQTIQPQQIIVQDPYKSDMQDFKGGLKFELSRNIHQIIPSGSESAG